MFEHLFGELGSDDNLIVMVNKYIATGQSYDTRMAQASRAVTLRHKPVECGELRPQEAAEGPASEGRSERESAEDQAEVEEPLAPRPHSI
jgi:hypothetical protein